MDSVQRNRKNKYKFVEIIRTIHRTYEAYRVVECRWKMYYLCKKDKISLSNPSTQSSPSLIHFFVVVFSSSSFSSLCTSLLAGHIFPQFSSGNPEIKEEKRLREKNTTYNNKHGTAPVYNLRMKFFCHTLAHTCIKI